MEKFEGLFEDLDVHTQVLDSTMSAATTLNTPEDQVESLMKQVAEQNGLEVLDKLAEHPVSAANSRQWRADPLHRGGRPVITKV